MAFTRLSQSQVSQLTGAQVELAKPHFQKWFDSRLKQAEVDLDSKTSQLFRKATFNALFDVSTPASKDKFHSVMYDGRTRAKLHTAAKWLGVKYVTNNTKAQKKCGKVRKLQSIAEDGPAFETSTHFTKFDKQKKESNKRKSIESGPSVSCDNCGVSSHTTDICMSVYHDGYFCDECLAAGACETDPENGSKWELWDPRWHRMEMFERYGHRLDYRYGYR